jgi:hypothetical protein
MYQWLEFEFDRAGTAAIVIMDSAIKFVVLRYVKP